MGAETNSRVMKIGNIEVEGVDVDNETRCSHYSGERDVIAIKFKCCDRYYPCYECHEELTDHRREIWERDEFDRKAVLCGVCGSETTVKKYLNSDFECPECGTDFNPGCEKHYDLYFDV